MSNNLPYRQFGYFTGINNVAHINTLTTSDLSEGVNVYLDNIGRCISREGYNRVLPGNYHSLWSDGENCFFVEGTSLRRMDTANNTTTLVTGLTANLRMSFIRIADRIFYSNGEVIGCIQNNIQRALLPAANTEYKSAMRAGEFLAEYNSRLWSAKGNIFYFSDAFSPETIDRRKFRIMVNGRITMIQGVGDGLFVSYGGNTYFLQETEPYIFTQVFKTDSEAIPYTNTVLTGALIGKGGVSLRTVIWSSTKGVCLALSDGSIKNVTIRRYIMPAADTGACIYKQINNGETHYISVLQN